MGNTPVKNVRDGAFSCAIFETEVDGKKNHQISLDKAFKRKDSEEWEHQRINLFPEDLLRIASLCERTYWNILSLREKTTTKPAEQKPAEDKATLVKVEDGDDIPF